MTSIPTTADLLRLLREDPDFRDEVRRLVLSQELLELPDRFARFEANVERRLTTIDSDLGGLKGAEYERCVGKSFASYASMAFRQRHGRGLRRNRLIYSNILGKDAGFDELISDAVDDGLISDDEKADLEQADAVMSGQDGGATVYYVGEISLTVSNRDIDRAIARATTLSKVTGQETRPMVIGDTIPAPQRSRIEAEGVAWRQVAEQSSPSYDHVLGLQKNGPAHSRGRSFTEGNTSVD